MSEDPVVFRSASDEVDEASEPLLAGIKQRLPELEELLKVSQALNISGPYHTIHE